jgi:ABC-type glycerol-3-phosphate transport system permease component
MAKNVLSSRTRLTHIFTHLLLIAGAFVAMTPFVWMVMASVMSESEARSATFFPSELHLDNFSQAWNDAKFSEYFVNSVLITFITVSGQVVFCTLAAYAFARMNFPGRNLIFTVLLSTLMIPESVVMIPNFITVTWLGRVGPIPWINNWPALTIPFMATIIGIFLLRQFFAQIPHELWDAAQIDGADHVRFLFQVVLPLSKAPLMTLVIFGFIGSWNAFAWPLLVTNTEEWRPITVGLNSFLEEAGALVHLQMAGAVITILPILILYFLTQKQFTEGIAHSGIKG